MIQWLMFTRLHIHLGASMSEITIHVSSVKEDVEETNCLRSLKK